MAALRVHLFGRLTLLLDGREISGLDARRIQELFSYLLLRRGRTCPREALASILWAECTTEQSRKYLRQTLWQLQTVLENHVAFPCASILCVEPEWISIKPHAELWLDVAVLEQAFKSAENAEGGNLDLETARKLQDAAELYRGDLLEGWYQDWCIFDRERLQNMYLCVLDKLMNYCESSQTYDTGIQYGTRILSFDRARERTHRQLMLLHYLAGDRTSALRQYEQCKSALQEELGVKPAKRTAKLHEEIRADQVEARVAPIPRGLVQEKTVASPVEGIVRLNQVRELLTAIDEIVRQEIRAVSATAKEKA